MHHYHNSIFITRIDTPIGNMLGGATENGVCLLEFIDRKNLKSQLNSVSPYFKKETINGHKQYLLKLQQQINLYFLKKLDKFDLQLDLAGTEFQKSVW